jgi:biopolymer transport protein ExbD
VQGKFRQPEAIERILRTSATNNPLTQTVVIRADKQADWQHVSNAFDLCKKVGIYEYTAVMDGQ